jgi:hypothetical protein
MAKEAYVGVRLTAPEFQRLEALAEFKGQTRSEALRSLLNSLVVLPIGAGHEPQTPVGASG